MVWDMLSLLCSCFFLRGGGGGDKSISICNIRLLCVTPCLYFAFHLFAAVQLHILHAGSDQEGSQCCDQATCYLPQGITKFDL